MGSRSVGSGFAGNGGSGDLFRDAGRAIWSHVSRGRYHPNDGHHAAVFVFGDVTMVDKVANVGSTKVDAYRNSRIRMIGVAIPIGNLNGVQVLAVDCVIGFSAVYREVILG